MRRRAAVDGKIIRRRDQHAAEPQLGGELAGAPGRWQGEPEMISLASSAENRDLREPAGLVSAAPRLHCDARRGREFLQSLVDVEEACLTVPRPTPKSPRE